MKLLVEWLAKLPERPRTIFKTCAYGFVAGLVAVAFQLAINGCYRAGIVRLSHCSFTTFLWSSLGLILGTSLISGRLLNSFCTDAAGSGIPQLKAAFWKNFGFVPFRVLGVKFIAATLQIGGGSSLGREGPSVQLAGIQPEHEQTTALGNGQDYVEKERKVALPLKDEAAYLIICRGDDLFTSGMVLITPLKIEVQEDPASGRVRANVLDTLKGGYRPDVHVKAIGSADTEFRSGETDLRGLFVADNVHGKATVIAREGESRYAFFRGETWLGASLNAPAAPPRQAGPQGQRIEFQGNLDAQNGQIQEFNNARFNQQRRQAPSKGVQTKQAF